MKQRRLKPVSDKGLCVVFLMLGVTGDVGGKGFITLEMTVIRSDSESFTVWQLRLSYSKDVECDSRK